MSDSDHVYVLKSFLASIGAEASIDDGIPIQPDKSLNIDPIRDKPPHEPGENPVDPDKK